MTLTTRTNNLFLDALPPADRELLLQASSLLSLPARTVLVRAHESSPFCYFLVSGVASAVLPTPEGVAAEVGMQGRETVIGAFQLLGPTLSPTESVMQLGGAGYRVRTDALQRVFADYVAVRTRLLEVIQADAFLASQIAGCHALHEIVARLSRWLLMAQDRTGFDVLHFTQEFLAQMLGATRTTVTAIAGELQQKGLIEYRRGRIVILDRERLIGTACSCYPITRSLLESTLNRQRAAAQAGGTPPNL